MMRALLIATLMLGLVACSQDSSDSSGDDASAPDAAAEESSPASESSAAAPEPTAEQVPVAEDFEAEASNSIDEDNYRQTLEALEQEIESDS